MALSVGVANPGLLNPGVGTAVAPTVGGVGLAPTYHSVATQPGAVATFAPGAAQAPIQGAAISSSPSAGTGSGTTTGTGTSASPNYGNAAQINSNYNIGSGFYQNELNSIPGQQNAAQGVVNNQYNDNLTSLQHQRDAAYANLDNQTNVVNQSYTKRLQQLGNNVRNTLQGQENALGTQGAGDSSANGMLGYALAQEQNQSRGYMNQDLNNQLNTIGLTKNADTNQFADQANQLNDWKGQQYQQIANQYANLRSQIGSQYANNEQARQNALMYAGQWAQNQANAIHASVNDAVQGMDTAYQQAANPNYSLSNLPSYTAQAINAPTVSAQGMAAQSTSPSDVTTSVSPLTYRDQSQQLTY